MSLLVTAVVLGLAGGAVLDRGWLALMEAWTEKPNISTAVQSIIDSVRSDPSSWKWVDAKVGFWDYYRCEVLDITIHTDDDGQVAYLWQPTKMEFNSDEKRALNKVFKDRVGLILSEKVTNRLLEMHND